MSTDPQPAEEDTILTVLHGFCAAMHAWEQEACTLRAQTDTRARLQIDQPYHVIYHASTVPHDGLETWQETYPEFAHHHNLERVCYGYVVMDVIECALDEAKQCNLLPDTPFLVEAINYYNENDCFMEFEPPDSAAD